MTSRNCVIGQAKGIKMPIRQFFSLYFYMLHQHVLNWYTFIYSPNTVMRKESIDSFFFSKRYRRFRGHKWLSQGKSNIKCSGDSLKCKLAINPFPFIFLYFLAFSSKSLKITWVYTTSNGKAASSSKRKTTGSNKA